MILKRRIILAVCILFLSNISQSCLAQTIVLHHTNGTTTDVELSTKPIVQFQNDMVQITSPIIRIEYPLADILRFTYKGIDAGISTPKNDIRYSQEGDLLILHNLKPTDKMAVYDLNGVFVPAIIQRSGNDATLYLSSLPVGVYILNVNGKTAKFVKL